QAKHAQVIFRCGHLDQKAASRRGHSALKQAVRAFTVQSCKASMQVDPDVARRGLFQNPRSALVLFLANTYVQISIRSQTWLWIVTRDGPALHQHCIQAVSPQGWENFM